MKANNLKVILEKHEKSLVGGAQGARADLSWADLRGVDLKWENLREAKHR